MSEQEKKEQGELKGREDILKQALQKSALTIRQLLEENAALQQKEPIAIIGMACRFPGGANSPDQFWQLLQDGVDAITEVPENRWSASDYYSADPNAAGKMYTVRGGFLNTPVDGFDTAFFGIAPKEAHAMDPQHRLLLEVCWEALEQANLPPASLKNSKTGVYVGISSDDYARSHRHSGQPESIDAYAITGSSFSTAVGRLSYTLGLQGPCMALDTACSSSLVALHLARRSLQSGESNLALVGGVNLMLFPELHICFSKLQAISPDGKCKTFDASANGYVRGEGCGMVILKRLKDAIQDGNKILAVVKGTAINQDGKTNGLAAPNGNAQQAVIREALADAGLPSDALDYIEAHGTGTILGDPIEAEAIGALLGSARPAPLRLGSVKTNIGHLEPAAGMAGLIKLLLALEHEELPKTLHFQQPNPHIAWDDLPIQVVTKNSAWQRSARPRVAGLSSFGFSGTNAHVIIAEAPLLEQRVPLETTAHAWLLNLSAQSESALRALAADYLQILAQELTPVALTDLCYSASLGRHHWPQRLAVTGNNQADLKDRLLDFLENRDAVDIAYGHVDTPEQGVAFLFTGQGAQYQGMTRALYQNQRVFKQAIDRCDVLLQPLLNVSLLDLLFSTEPDVLNQTAYAQPALFAVEYALYSLWNSWGVTPSVLVGHSVGEYVAACVAGVFSLEEGLKLIAERGRLMQALPAGGSMAAVFATESRISAAIAPYRQLVDIAAYNGPEQLVISGDEHAVLAVCQKLNEEGVSTSLLTVSHAFHSQRMEPMLAEFSKVAQQVRFSSPRIKLASNITGDFIGAEIATADYWVTHIRQPVAFAASMALLARQGIRLFVEMGPQAVLCGLGRRCITDTAVVWLPSLQRNVPDSLQLSRALAGIYTQGVAVDWTAVYAYQQCRWFNLPTYPFQRQKFWMQPPVRENLVSKPASSHLSHPLLDNMVRSPLLEAILFETRFSEAHLPILQDHHIFGKTVVSGACLTSMVLGAARQALGDGVIQLADTLFHQALAIADAGTRAVHLALKPLNDGWISYRLISMEADNPAAEGMPHVTGTLRVQPYAGYQSSAILVAPESQWAEFDREISQQTVYQAISSRSIELGRSNQWLEAVRLSSSSAEAIARLRIPDYNGQLLDTEGYLLHPGLIDSCYGLLMTVIQLKDDETWVPFAIERFNFVRPAVGERFWVHIRRRVLAEFPDKLLGDIQLMNEQGELVAECIGLEGRAATPKTLLRSLATDISPWFYQLDWLAQDIQTPVTDTVAQNWLIFMDDAGYGASIAQRLTARGCTVAAVYASSHFKQAEDGVYHVNPMQVADMQQLLVSAFSRDYPCGGIVYLWGLNHYTPLSVCITQSCAPLLHLVQAVTVITQTTAPALVLITQGVQSIASSTSVAAVRAEQAPLWGLGKTIALEHPELCCTRIDLDPQATLDANSDCLFQELLNLTRETQVAWRDGNRFVARLARYHSVEQTQSFPVHQNGHYLICGGLGGLGLLLARELVNRGARYLTLCGRSAASTEALLSISELETLGAIVYIHLADITLEEQVQSVISTASSRMPVTGIIHAAGILDDGVLAHLDWSRFEKVLAAKTVGLHYLHEYSRQLPLDFFVGFSSIVSLTGSPAQGAYVAANSFVDALMCQRQAEGLPGLSINWGPWADAGMAARLDHNQRSRMSAQGVNVLSAEDAFRALDCLWPEPPVQVGVMDISWPQFLSQFPGAISMPLFASFHSDIATESGLVVEKSQVTWATQLEQLPVARRRSALIDLLRTEINRVLGAAVDQPIELRKPLFDLGLDSLTAVELKSRLTPALACQLNQTLLFDYPTLEALTNYLCTLIPVSFEIAETTVTATEIPVSNHRTAELDEMSQAELEDLLLQKLQLLAE